MSSVLLPLHRCCRRAAVLAVSQRWRSSSASRPSLMSRVLSSLGERYYDVQWFNEWMSKKVDRTIRRKNRYYGLSEVEFGPNVGTAYFVLAIGGGVRFSGQSEWFRPNWRGKIDWKFLDYKDITVEEIDLSGTLIDYEGLTNLKKQKPRTLKLSGCTRVDDWCLAGLHVYHDCLEELDISHCPNLTVHGLPALRNLRKLKQLNISSMPKLSHPGLVAILLEEMFPHCQVIAEGYDTGLSETAEKSAEQQT